MIKMVRKNIKTGEVIELEGAELLKWMRENHATLPKPKVSYEAKKVDIKDTTNETI